MLTQNNKEVRNSLLYAIRTTFTNNAKQLIPSCYSPREQKVPAKDNVALTLFCQCDGLSSTVTAAPHKRGVVLFWMHLGG